MSIVIGGLQKSSLLDFPDKISAIVFTRGCNFRCGYCHNPELCTLTNEPVLTVPAFFEFLMTRKGKLDGVVITGGEPTLHKDLPKFIQNIKQMGFAAKLDTNGTNPIMLEQLLNANLLDYVAMDIKAPLDKYIPVTDTKNDIQKIEESIKIIMNSNVDYEFRTTVVRSQLTKDDFRKIGELISGAKRYYLQKFQASKTLDESFMNAQTYSDEEFSEIAADLKEKIRQVYVR